MVLRFEQFSWRWMAVIGVGIILLIPAIIVFAQMKLDAANQELIKYRDEYNAVIEQWRNAPDATNANNVFQKANTFFVELQTASGAELTGPIGEQIKFAESVQTQAKQMRRMYVQVQIDTMRQYVGEMNYLVHDGMTAALIRGDDAQIETLLRAQTDFELWNKQLTSIANDIEKSDWSMSEQQRLNLQGLQQTLAEAHDNLIIQAPSLTKAFKEIRVPEIQGGFTGSLDGGQLGRLRAEYGAEQQRERREEEERRRKNEGPISENPESGGGAGTHPR